MYPQSKEPRLREVNSHWVELGSQVYHLPELLLIIIQVASAQAICVLPAACVKLLRSTPRCRSLLREASSLLVGYLPVCSFFRVTVDCMDPTCSGRGVCVRGECHCSVGWGGTTCDAPRATCSDQCSGHGTFLPDTGLCSCDPSWTGHDCSIGKCGEKRDMAWMEGGGFRCNMFSIQS